MRFRSRDAVVLGVCNDAPSVAGAVAFLVAPAARFATGALSSVDGGYTVA